MNFHSSSSSGMAMSGVIWIGTYTSVEFRGGIAHDDFALRHRNGDLMLLEQAPYRAVDFRAYVVDALLRIGNPETQFKLDAAVAEVHQARHRRGIAQYARLPMACLEQYFQRQFRIVSVADADGQLQADARIGVAPIDHGIGDQLLIGHQHFHAVAVAHDHIAPAQFLHPAEVLGAGARLSRETDDVARLDRPIHEQHEAADEIGRDGLQTEAQSQADGAG